MRGLLVVALGLSAAACSSPIVASDAGRDGGGGSSDGGTDGGETDAGGSLDGGPDADLFVVTGTIEHVEDDGTESVPVDFASLALEVRVRDVADDLSEPLFPTVNAATYRGFEGVPHGASYTVRTDVGHYHVVPGRVLDLSARALGRPDVVPASAGTELALTIDGLDAWRTGDVIEVVSTNANVYFYLDETVPGPTFPGVGATTLSDFRVGWDGWPLIRGERNDVLRVFHNSTTTIAGSTVRIVRDEYTSPSFSMSDGVVAMRNGSFASVAVDTTVPVSWRTTAFESFLGDVGPTGSVQPGLHILDYLAQPNRPPGADTFSGSLDCFVVEADGTADVALGDVSFGNPFEPTDLLAAATVVFPVEYSFPGATPTVAGVTSPNVARVEVLREDIAGTSVAPFAPLVAPPTEVQVDGVPLDDFAVAPDVVLDHDVLLEWTPGVLLAAPTGYRVVVMRGVLGASGEARRERVAVIEIHDSTPSCVLPPEILASGEHYHVIVEAQYAAAPGAVPFGRASHFSSFFHTTVAP